jgi:hypothetical protein
MLGTTRTLPPPSSEHLLSVREAALSLAVNPSTAQLRARQRLRAGYPAVRIIAGAYVAPLGWWQELLKHPITPVGHARMPELPDSPATRIVVFASLDGRYYFRYRTTAARY